MRSVVPIAFVALVMAGCSSSSVNKATTPGTPKPDVLQSNYGEDVNKVYGKKILSAIDRFDVASRQAQVVDANTAKTYEKEGRFPKLFLGHLNQAAAVETRILKDMQTMTVPSQFESFHQAVLKSTEQKLDNFSGLILAMEKPDKAEIDKVLAQIETTGKLSRIEMEKVLQGKTAEQYLGLNP